MSILKINKLKYSELFDDLSIDISDNMFVTVSGPNNCGKTTLIRILSREINGNFDIEVLNKPINEYKLDEYSRTIQSIIPNETYFIEKNLYEEMNYNCNSNLSYIEYICKGLKIKKIVNNEYSTYSNQEKVLAQLAIALTSQPKILMIDNISPYFSNKEIESIIEFLKEYQRRYNLTIIYTTLNLDESLNSDYLYIINDGKIELEGEPSEILQKDNIINKIGLDIPFMIDLSVKLRDYDLIKDIETDKDRMVDKLWN